MVIKEFIGPPLTWSEFIFVGIFHSKIVSNLYFFLLQTVHFLL